MFGRFTAKGLTFDKKIYFENGGGKKVKATVIKKEIKESKSPLIFLLNQICLMLKRQKINKLQYFIKIKIDEIDFNLLKKEKKNVINYIDSSLELRQDAYFEVSKEEYEKYQLDEKLFFVFWSPDSREQFFHGYENLYYEFYKIESELN